MTASHDSATPAGHVFVSYARHDEAFVLQLCDALRRRDVPIWIDQWHIAPGADWNRTIDAALRQCASFLIVLSPEAVASDEVLSELRVALNGRKRIVPLLYRPCEMPRQLLLRQHFNFTRSRELTDAQLDALVRALRQPAAMPARVLSSEQERENRRTLLDDVSVEARDRLEAIGTSALMPIRLDQRPEQVERPWDNEVAVPVRPLPAAPVTDSGQLLDESGLGGRVLILGPPGGGKTTLLLQLLQQLAARAESNESQPIPVLLSLASWDDDATIGEWLVEELKAKHGVRTDVGRRWRDDRLIAPLLDGLDELPAERQPACVSALNEFDQEYRPPYLIVCCREAEYENLTVKLRLRGAVSLRPLAPEQIRTYLMRAERLDLWTAIESDPALLEMAQSPLLLSFMIGVPQHPSPPGERDGSSIAARRQRLFDAYVLSHASSANPRGAYSRARTLRWLQQMATVLKRQGRSEFLIEQMQPEWFQSPVQRWAYRVGVFGVSAAIVVGVMRTTFSVFDLVPVGTVGRALQSAMPPVFAEGNAVSLPLLLGIAICIGAVVAARRTIVPIETLSWSWSRAGTNAGRWAQAAALAGLDYGMAFGTVGSLLFQLVTFDFAAPISWSHKAGLACGLAGAGLAAGFLVLVRPSGWLPFVRRPILTSRIAIALVAALIYAVAIGTTASGLAAPFCGVAVLAIIGFSAASNDRFQVLVRGLMTGGLCGAGIGVLSGSVVSRSPFLAWATVWTMGGLAVGFIAGMGVILVGRFVRRARAATRTDLAPALASPWSRTIAVSVLMATALGVIAMAAVRMGWEPHLAHAAVFVWWMHVELAVTLALMLFLGIGGGLSVVVTAGVLGALAGAVSGATGADVERRLVPNQGIRQSLRNVPIFAALGLLIVGVPYGLLNLSVAAVVAGALPSAGDWLRLGVGAGAGFGLIAGFLPGAACVQHLVLRIVLWASGTLPFRYGTFLNFATQRRLLQRVGGRYRFIHILLRDHLGHPQVAG